MSAPTLSVPRTNPTQDAALYRVTRGERPAGLMVSIGERCGDALIEAFRRAGLAYYAERDAA